MTKPERTALERSAAEQNRLIADVAASVNAGVPSRERRLNGPPWTEEAKRELADLSGLPASTFDDDEDAILDEGEPREIPLTEAQKRAAYWDEKTDADEAWREEPEE